MSSTHRLARTLLAGTAPLVRSACRSHPQCTRTARAWGPAARGTRSFAAAAQPAAHSTHDNHSSDHGSGHGSAHGHGFETSPPPAVGAAPLVAAAAAAVAAVAYLVASRREVVPSYKLDGFAPVSVGAGGKVVAAPSVAAGEKKKGEERETATAATEKGKTAGAATQVNKAAEDTQGDKTTAAETKTTAAAAAETDADADADRPKAVVTEELMDATKCLPGYLSERLSEFKIGMLKEDIIGLSAELKNGRKVYASVVGTINNEYKTIGLWPESAARNGFDRGVVVYLKDAHVVGVLLWGLTQQADTARSLLKRTEPVTDPKELYHLFSL